jgi:hypothetical protein
MREGVFIMGLIAVTIIAASLAATPASACHPIRLARPATARQTAPGSIKRE